jgi:chromosome segregation ATPase
MADGRATLQRIDREIAGLRAEEAQYAAQVAEVTDGLARLRNEEIEAYRELARFRLDAEQGRRIGGALEAAEARARQMLAERERALAEFGRRVEEVAARAHELEAERSRLAAELSARHAEVDRADAALIERLARTDDYNARLAAVEAAERIAVEAERKAELAAADRLQKGQPYEADTLFMYLWNRGYGTPDYRGRGLIRALDGWVARLVGYQDARANYHMLTEIPLRLGEHAQRARQAAEAAAAELDAYEAGERRAAGILDIEAGAAALDQRIAAIAEDLKAADVQRDELETARAALLRGEDETSRAAVATLVEALRAESLPQLRRAALLTPDPADEAIVDRLERLDDRIADLEEEQQRRLRLQQDLEAKRRDLEQVRGRYVAEGFDDQRWEFDDRAIEEILKALVRGAMTGAILWKGLRGAGRYTPPSRPPSRGRTSGGGPVFRPPSRPSPAPRSPGGFRTGGTIGRGGGFRTGGRF